ncbi:MAG: hypothetical protein QOF28_999 [Actinomycetota bacterium]|jgi:hypothetical protein|nr:hypothetical protein [Actinomycetota bacterium]
MSGVELKPGTRLQSVVCTTQMIVIRAPSEAIDLRCGGHALVSPDQVASPGLEVEPGFDGGTLLGKRYTDERQSFELLCTKAGRGALSVGVVPLVLSGAKPLPASD